MVVTNIISFLSSLRSNICFVCFFFGLVTDLILFFVFKRTCAVGFKKFSNFVGLFQHVICNRNEILVAPSEFGPVALDEESRKCSKNLINVKLKSVQSVFPTIQVFGFVLGWSKNDYLNSRGRHGLRIV